MFDADDIWTSRDSELPSYFSNIGRGYNLTIEQLKRNYYIQINMSTSIGIHAAFPLQKRRTKKNAFHLQKRRTKNKLASLEATLVRNYYPATQRLTGVRCRATSVAKNNLYLPTSLTNTHAFYLSLKWNFNKSLLQCS